MSTPAQLALLQIANNFRGIAVRELAVLSGVSPREPDKDRDTRSVGAFRWVRSDGAGNQTETTDQQHQHHQGLE